MTGSGTRRIHTAYRFSIPIISLPVAKVLHIDESNGMFRTAESRFVKTKRETKRMPYRTASFRDGHNGPPLIGDAIALVFVADPLVDHR
jgi:hypothetical protein